MPEETMTAAPAETGVAPASEVSTSSPAVTETSTPSEPHEFSAPAREPNEDDGAYARRFMEARTAFDTKKPAEVKAEPAKTEPAKEPEKPAEAPKAEETPEEDPDAPDPFEDRAPIAAKEISELLKANPELDKQLDALGVKGKFYENARLAAKAIDFMEVFPDKDTAEYAKGAAENFGTIDNFMTEIPTKGKEGVDALLNHMWNLDVVVDQEGKPVLDDKGQTIPQGNVEAFVKNFSDIVWEQRLPAHFDALEAQAKAMLEADPDNDQANNILAAVDVLKNAKVGSVPQELPPNLKAERDRIETEKQNLERAKEESRNAEVQQRENSVLSQSEQTIHGEIDSLLGRTALPKEQYGLIRNEIYDAIVDQLTHDKMFQSKRDWIMRSQWSDSVAKQRVAHNVQSMKNILYGTRGNGIARQVLEKYGVKMLAKQGERKQTIDAQIKATQSEPRGRASVAAPAADKTPAEKRAIAVENLKKQGIEQGDPEFIGKLFQEMQRV